MFFRHHTATLVTSDTFILFIFSYSLAFDQVLPITSRARTLLSYTVCPAVWQIELKSAVFERPFGCRLRLTLIISYAFPDLYLCNSNTKFFFSGFPTVPAIFLWLLFLVFHVLFFYWRSWCTLELFIFSGRELMIGWRQFLGTGIGCSWKIGIFEKMFKKDFYSERHWIHEFDIFTFFIVGINIKSWNWNLVVIRHS